MARIDDVRELAEKVMRWEVTKTRHGGFDIKRPTHLRDIYPWNPYTDPRAALEVVEAMWKKDWAWDGGNVSEGIYSAAFFADGYYFRCEGTFCESICTAALAAIREAK